MKRSLYWKEAPDDIAVWSSGLSISTCYRKKFRIPQMESEFNLQLSGSMYATLTMAPGPRNLRKSFARVHGEKGTSCRHVETLAELSVWHGLFPKVVMPWEGEDGPISDILAYLVGAVSPKT